MQCARFSIVSLTGVCTLLAAMAGVSVPKASFAQAPSGLVSDAFNSASLDTGVWSWVDPVGNSSYAMSGSQLALSVPQGSSHDLWSNANQAPRVLQPANNTDFELETKFDSTLAARYQFQGIVVEGSGNRLLRFDFYSDGATTRVHAATLTNGTASKKIAASIVTGAPLYLRVVRQGNQWTQYYSYDGANWILAGSFSYTLTVTAAGVFGGNAGPNPAYTALVDYYTIDGLPPGSGGGGDVTPPVISNVNTVATATTATITWQTDEPATSTVDHGLTAGYGSTASSAGLVTSHSLTLTDLSPGTLYHFQVSSTDSGNSRSASIDFNFMTSAASLGKELRVVPISNSRIDLYWDDISGAAGYRVYRDAELITSTADNRYSDTGASGNHSHSYQVVALLAGNYQPIAPPVAVPTVDSGKGDWWDSNWPYRSLVGIGAGEYQRTDAVAELDLNITELLTDTGQGGSFNPATVRCHEVDISGAIIGSEISCQFDPSQDFDPSNRATGKLVLLAPGITAPYSARYFHFYFDTFGGSSTPAALAPLVTVRDNVVDEGQASYQISTSTGSYFFQKAAGGFSSLLDLQGNDWIDYHPAGGAAGSYRGIPNLVYPESHFHPGSETATSTIINQGPVKTTLRSQTLDGLWQLTWEFYPRIATMTLLAAAKPYWFLYEGTPGGQLDVSSDFMVRSSGVKTLLSQSWNGDIAGDDWVYFSDPVVGRSLFLAQHLSDDAVDSYRPMNGQMTVFGFGRKQTGLDSYLNRVPARFTIGLIDKTDYRGIADSIDSSVNPLSAGVSPVAGR